MKLHFLAGICLVLVLVAGCKSATPTPSSPGTKARPSGTYVATVLGVEQSLTFKGDVFERYDPLGGKEVFKYTISEDGSTITATNVATGVTWTRGFKYIKDFECVVIDYGDGAPVQYYKK
jgi:hypothetical protein